LARALEYLLALMLVVITLLVFANVLTRYVLMYSIIWSEEVARFAFIWLIFIGTAVAIKRKAHFHLSLFEFADGSIAKRGTEALATLAVLALSFVLVHQGIALVGSTMGQSSPNIGIPMGYAYVAIPLAGALILVFLGLDFLASRLNQQKDSATGTDTSASSPARG
jgi:TRAP-type C4-dicarboxylate transport system permease small subunit